MTHHPSHNLNRPSNLQAFGKILREARDNRALTLDALAQATGISKPYLSQIETARTPGPPSPQKLRRLAKALGLDPEELLAAADWLRAPASIRRALTAVTEKNRPPRPDESPAAITAPGGAPAPLPRRPDGAINLDALMAALPDSTRSPLPRRESPAETIPLRRVPVINRVAAGTASEHTDLDYPAGIADQYVPAPDLPEAPIAAAFAVRIRGDSMTPEYHEGDLVIVGPPGAEGPHDGQDCVVRLGELDQFATTFKRVYLERDQTGEPVAVRLVPLNPAHVQRRVPIADVSGIYPLMYRLVPAKSPAAAE